MISIVENCCCVRINRTKNIISMAERRKVVFAESKTHVGGAKVGFPVDTPVELAVVSGESALSMVVPFPVIVVDKVVANR